MRTRYILLAVFVVLAAVSGIGIWQQLRPKQVTFRLKVQMPSDPSPAIRLLADGRELGVFTQTTSLTLPSRSHRKLEPEAMLPELTAQAMSPCGWRDVKLSVSGAPTAEDLKAAERDEKELPLRLSTGQLQMNTVEFWADNRRGAEVRLAIGQMELKIPADAHQEYVLPVVECPGGLEVKLDGRKVADLPAVVAKEGFEQGNSYSLGHPDVDESISRVFLLDLSGARCYRISEKAYAKPGSWGFGSDTVKYYSRKHLHRLDPTSIDYFLEKAPQKVQVSASFSSMLFDLRNELMEIPCH